MERTPAGEDGRRSGRGAYGSRNAFVREIAARATLPDCVTPEAAALSVVSRVAKRLDGGGAHGVLRSLPPEIQGLLEPAIAGTMGSASWRGRRELLDETADELGVTPAQAESICRAVLNVVREELPPEIAERVAAQLPADLKVLWRAEAPVPATPIAAPVDPRVVRDDVLESIERATPLPPGIDGASAFGTVMGQLSLRLSGSEARRIFHALPRPLRALMASSLLQRAEPSETFDAPELVHRVGERIETSDLAAARVVRAVFAAAKSCLPRQEIRDVSSQLPRDLRAMWLEAGSPP